MKTKGANMSKGVDPTMAGITDSSKRLARLKEQRDILKSHIEQLEDKIYCIECEIAGTSCVDGFVAERDWPRKL